MGLLAWFHGRNSTGRAESQVLVPKVTMLTLLERRRMQRARRATRIREAVERLFQAQMACLAATEPHEIEAAGLDLALAEAELRLLHEFPGD